MNKKALGKGLEALFVSKSQNNQTEIEKIEEIPLELINPNPYQPRDTIKEEHVEELSNSIAECGIIHPISVRKIGDRYEIIEGERRFRAFKKIGRKTIPAIIRNIDDIKMLLMALVENLQRENLNPIEEAKGYQRLITEFKLTHQEIAEKVGKSRVAITNTLRLLNLPHLVKEGIETKKITSGHARALLGLDNPNIQRKAYNLIIEKNLSVHDTEKLVKKWQNKTLEEIDALEKSQKINDINPDIKLLEEQLSEKLKTKVKIKDKNNKGLIMIEYYSIDDFQKLFDTLINIKN
ncbi:MAG TPA: ParB/RepB/Spo0J family partition protein [bacterium]|nr:ParB/RepB/Spo0J family partition protein [bacterium]HOL46582.1 ParB/RepB/Spo0J family partition protein [bacterium]HPQ17847.1 ParB/RepB/Spo0J family partition protein [bacterium]